MQTYHFGQDLLDTYQSMSPFVQALWALMLPGFLLGLFAIWLNYRLRLKQCEPLHPFEIPDEDVDRIIAYRPPDEALDAPMLIAVTRREV